jgi:hypothetical protein
MPAQRYMVHGAVLTKRPDGPVWTLTLRPVRTPEDWSSSEDDRELVVTVSPQRIDEMEFALSYTLEELDALAEH